MFAVEMKKEAANKTLHIQIERKARRTWQCPNISSNFWRIKCYRSGYYFVLLS
jgi:hypothetical protein